MKVRVYSAYDLPPNPGIEFTDPSMTEQHFKDECDINHIMWKYNATGVLGDPTANPTVRPEFGDFYSQEDFQFAMNVLAESKQLFDELPSDLRLRFANDPALMLAFLDDEANREEAVKLGLVQPPPVVPQVIVNE